MARGVGGAAILIVALLAGTGGPHAHRLDEYLQAARIAVGPGQVTVEMDLTPGAAIAARIVARIDTDRDDRISPVEARAYALAVLGDVAVTIDNASRPLTLVGHQVPEVEAIRAGTGTIRIGAATEPRAVAPGPHVLAFRNAHAPDVGVYLVNALKPASESVRITGQVRDEAQRGLRLSYTVRGRAMPAWVYWGAALAAAVTLVVLRARSRRT